MIIVLMGVAGSGKTTVGTLLSQRLGWTFADGDDYHSPANKEKMRNGLPLDDQDRRPWLDSLRELTRSWIANGSNAVLACSALKRAYRDHLCVDRDVKFVYLKGELELLRERLRERPEHYMKEGMLDSQFATLEEPQGALVVDVSQPAPEIVEEIVAGLGLSR